MPRPATRWIGAVALSLAWLPGCGAEPAADTVPSVHVQAGPAPTPPPTTTSSTTSTTAAPATTAATARVCCAYSVERAARQRVPITRAPAPPPSPASPAAPPAGAGASMPSLLRRIGGCESSGRPDGPLRWQADNPTSSASGAFQIIDSTWRSWARAYGADVGAPQYARARHAPPDVQTTVAQRALDAQGTTPWRASRSCWG